MWTVEPFCSLGNKTILNTAAVYKTVFCTTKSHGINHPHKQKKKKSSKIFHQHKSQ